MRRKSESTSAAKREAHDRADAAMPDVAGLTVKQAEMALAEARNRERERREYERRKAKGKPLSKITQDAIRYEKCFESGVVKVEKGLYSITCDVDNMDYRNLGESEKEALYVRLLRVYNLFEPTTHLQWSVIVRVVGRRSILDEVLISHQPDGLDRLRDEVNEVLTDRASKGKTDIETRLLLTICTKADNEAEAQSILDGLVKDIRPDFESMGSGLTVLSGAEWLEIVAGVFWPSDVLVFDWATLVDTKTGKATGLTTKDAVAPMSLAFEPRILKPRPNGTTSVVKDRGIYRCNDFYASTLLLRKSPGMIDDRMVSVITSTPMDMMFTIHMQPTSAESSRKATDAYIAAVEGDTHDRAKEARRENMPAGVYMTSKHVDRAQDAEELKKEVQFGGHKLFYTTMSAHVRAETPDDLKLEQIPKLQRACGRWGVSATPLSGRERQKDAMNATLPIGKNFINAPSTMTTANVGALIPFTSRRYQDPGGIYWGVDAESEDFIMLDRTALGAPHQMVFGITGSGKSFGLCRENLQILLRRPRAKVYIASPGLAYKPFVQLLGGKWFEVGAGSKDYFNVMSINIDQVEDVEQAIADKAEYLMGQVECMLYKGAVMDGKDTRAAKEATLLYSCIQDCIPKVYGRYLDTHRAEDVPVLAQLADELGDMKVPVARDAAQALSLFTTTTAVGGQFSQRDGSPFDDDDCRLFGVGFRNAGDIIKAPALFAFTDMFWRQAVMNKVKGYETWVLFDEFQTFMDWPIAAQYFLKAWMEGRKYDLYQTGATQNVLAVLENAKASRALDNSGVVTMYNMAHDDARELAERLHMSERQMRYTVNPPEGHGVLSVMGSVMPFKDSWPKGTETYKVFTSKPKETKGRAM